MSFTFISSLFDFVSVNPLTIISKRKSVLSNLDSFLSPKRKMFEVDNDIYYAGNTIFDF